MRLYLQYLSIHLRSVMQHKVSLFLTAAGQALMSFTSLFSIYFVMNRFYEIGGFTFQEISLCFSVVLMAFSVAECFARGFDTFASIIGNGEFDRMMVRPRGAVFQVIASKFEFTRVGRFLQAAGVMIYAVTTADVAWTGRKILTLVFMTVSGVIIFSCLFVIYAALCFFTTEGLEFMNVFTDGGREHGKYPFSIYGKHVLRFFTYVVPLALVQYYPFLYITGRTDNILYMFLPLAGALFAIPSFLLWKIGLRHYKSTGS
ncbi:MAG: ABC-2 family transporter protein [Oscillospiraceae bacterium]|jgi:ABC-2 type transport system permease protein|nr:ABC-2 family transporter protein [Oscillospiraceae bacterium]